MAVGYVVRAKGTRGEVRVEPLTPRLARFGDLRQVYLGRDGEPEVALQIESWRVDAPGVLLKFRGIDTPEEARDRLCGGYLTVPGEDVPPPPPGSHYVFDLVGCRVEDESGQRLGVIAEVLALPSTDVYLVRTGAGEVMVPAVADYIAEVRTAERLVVVRGVGELFA